MLSEDNSINEQSAESNASKGAEKDDLDKRKSIFNSQDALEEGKDKSKQEKRDRKEGKKNEWDMFAEADTLEEYNVSTILYYSITIQYIYSLCQSNF